MKFTLSTADCRYYEEEKILLEPLGFVFSTNFTNRNGKKIYNINGRPSIEIDTLSELMTFIDKHGGIIVDKDSIVIYDGYIE